ncbi:lipopolysaccharide assembly protein LapB [Nocardiopsis sp. FR26]|uniref:tetratricopeptide repeat protein n=1 Tax=Nocardiopsis sp. FR26 TaxID=2605987 RepID=UPI00135B5E2B|nr:tetratricopeptide repeat protein [Nocardiopsis sp. FR26]
MTTTSGPSPRSGSAEPPQATDPRDTEEAAAVPDGDAEDLCDQAQDLAESGHLARAAALYQQAAAAPHPGTRARALLGLAVVRDRGGDLPAAREAARAALETGDARHAPRAAYHLALSLEEDGQAEEAERVWRGLLDLGGAAYAAVARYGLARAAEERGDTGGAEEHWEAALTLPAGSREISRLHAATVVDAARDLAERLLARGLPGAAAAAVERGLAVADDPRLRLLRAAAHLEHAIADAGAVVERAGREDGEAPEPETSAAAVEVLAGLFALRGDPAKAERVWRLGLEASGPETADRVRGRLHRGFASPEEEDGRGPWWEPYLEEAAASASAPALAGELFAVVTQMHALLAVPVVEGESRPAVLRAAMEQALRTPSELVWGPDVHADFRRRLSEAMGGRDVLPEGWPDRG